MQTFNWNDIVFKDKSELKNQEYIFIVGFREISQKRFVEIIKTYLPKANLLIGVLKDDYIVGFEDQPHFKSMPQKQIIETLTRLSKVKLQHNVDSIEYFQRDLPNIIKKIKPAKAIFINGSWNRMFHLREEFYALTNNRIKYDLISPFTNEVEAREYFEKKQIEVDSQVSYLNQKYSDLEIFEILSNEAKRSYATDFQTSCAIIKDGKILTLSHNEVVPFETFAMHNGSVKERNFSPSNDLNHYDANHAEMMSLIMAQVKNINLDGTSLYINLMPCPTCSKILAKTEIQEIVYSQDHSEGYALKMFQAHNKKIRRYVP